MRAKLPLPSIVRQHCSLPSKRGTAPRPNPATARTISLSLFSSSPSLPLFSLLLLRSFSSTRPADLHEASRKHVLNDRCLCDSQTRPCGKQIHYLHVCRDDLQSPLDAWTWRRTGAPLFHEADCHKKKAKTLESQAFVAPCLPFIGLCVNGLVGQKLSYSTNNQHFFLFFFLFFLFFRFTF